LQLTILLEASKSKSSRTPDIAKLLNLDIKRVQHEIVGLAKNKIVLLNNKDEHHFIINNKFNSNKLKIKINNTAKFTAEEKKVHDEELSKDRDFKIQAAIVRIMKMRKELEHSNLISEAISDIKGFKPDVSSIKGNINILIEKEYLERDRKNKNMYRYLA
jgi:ABC-type bacteriocin/lantibiotic exporter with double-glycine peptidase domain